MQASRTCDGKRGAEAGSEEGPVPQREESALGIEGNVASRAVRVVIGRRQLGARGVEAPLTRQTGARSNGSAGKHLRPRLARVVSIDTPDAVVSPRHTLSGYGVEIRLVWRWEQLRGIWRDNVRINQTSRCGRSSLGARKQVRRWPVRLTAFSPPPIHLQLRVAHLFFLPPPTFP